MICDLSNRLMLRELFISGTSLISIACYSTASNCYHLSMILVPPYEVHNLFLMISWMAAVCAAGTCLGGF
jgi:hypothetical protein